MIRFLVFSDLHYDHIFDADKRIQKLLDVIQREKLNFVISLGDLCCPIKENMHIAESFCNLSVPFYPCVGNHDCEHYRMEELKDFWKRNDLFYSFVIEKTKFIVLNSCYMNHENVEIIYQKGLYNKTIDTYPIIPQTEFEWLKREIRDDMNYVIFSHHSLVNEYPKRGVSNRGAIREILKTKKVLLCMNGHDHGDDIKTVDSITYFTVNSMSYIWHGMKPMFSYTEEIHNKYPYLKDVILYERPLYCIVEIDGQEVKISSMDSTFQNILPEDVGIMVRRWNGVSIEPVISSWNIDRISKKRQA